MKYPCIGCGCEIEVPDPEPGEEPLYITFHEVPPDGPIDIRMTFYACKSCLAELEAARKQQETQP
jgi:DNA-directed RNA polymerase subunit RPC12/RpoP